MSIGSIPGLRLAGVVAATPSEIVDTSEGPDSESFQQIEKFRKMTGVDRRRVVPSDQCCSDLCLAAAEELIESLGWKRDTIDQLVFVTQTPDYFQPNNACLMHQKLELSETCACFDISLGCSGFPYGLSIASQAINSGFAKRVLVLHGETPSKVTHPEEVATEKLFGDAGSAAAIEADKPGGEWHFVLGTDGQGYEDLIVPGRGFRNPNPANERDNYLYMKGANIFNFSLKRVPPLVRDLLAVSDWQPSDIDHFFFHQANLFMLKHLIKKLKIDADRAPISINDFGNTGGVSVPLTMALHYEANPLSVTAKVMLVAFGIGLSWSACTLDVTPSAYFRHLTVNTDD